MITYKYTVEGGAANGQTWKTEGAVLVEKEGDFDLAVSQARRDSFMQLTHGEATYGQPGIAGCKGPYTITRFEIGRVTSHKGGL